MKIYKVKMESGYEWLLRGDFAQSASTLEACFESDGVPKYEDDLIWQGTPYQVADAGHNQLNAAKLVYSYLDDDDDKVEEVEEVEEDSGWSERAFWRSRMEEAE